MEEEVATSIAGRSSDVESVDSYSVVSKLV